MTWVRAWLELTRVDSTVHLTSRRDGRRREEGDQPQVWQRHRELLLRLLEHPDRCRPDLLRPIELCLHFRTYAVGGDRTHFGKQPFVFGIAIQGIPSARRPGLGWICFGCTLLARQDSHFCHQPKQKWANGGTTKIKVNPTQVSEQINYPVQYLQSYLNAISI